jgi:hypothetical protein
VPGAPAASCALGVVNMHTSIHSEVAEITRHSRTQWFTAYSVLSPEIGLSCLRRRRSELRQLDAGVEASGPHVFAVRVSAVRYRHLRVHRIPPRVRDDREPPLMWDGTARNTPVIWVWCEEEIFLQTGLDRKFSDLPVRQKCSPDERSEIRESTVGPGFRFAHPGYRCRDQIAPAAFSFAISSG